MCVRMQYANAQIDAQTLSFGQVCVDDVDLDAELDKLLGLPVTC